MLAEAFDETAWYTRLRGVDAPAFWLVRAKACMIIRSQSLPRQTARHIPSASWVTIARTNEATSLTTADR
jgi:hypothetical protein